MQFLPFIAFSFYIFSETFVPVPVPTQAGGSRVKTAGTWSWPFRVAWWKV